MPDQHQHQEWPEENCTLEEFNAAIDAAPPPDCPNCPSLGRMKPLKPLARKAAWLDYSSNEEERQVFVLEELEKALTRPFDDEVYQLILQSEMWKTDNIERLQKLGKLLLHYAEVMVAGKMEAAWVAVRAYAWNKGFDPLELLKFGSVEDKDVLKVVLQCSFNWSLPYWEDRSRAQLVRDQVYTLTAKAIETDVNKLHVAAVNGVLALMSFQDLRAPELHKRLGRNTMQRKFEETATRIKSHIRERGEDLSYIDVLNQITVSS